MQDPARQSRRWAGRASIHSRTRWDGVMYPGPEEKSAKLGLRQGAVQVQGQPGKVQRELAGPTQGGTVAASRGRGCSVADPQGDAEEAGLDRPRELDPAQSHVGHRVEPKSGPRDPDPQGKDGRRVQGLRPQARQRPHQCEHQVATVRGSAPSLLPTLPTLRAQLPADPALQTALLPHCGPLRAAKLAQTLGIGAAQLPPHRPGRGLRTCRLGGRVRRKVPIPRESGCLGLQTPEVSGSPASHGAGDESRRRTVAETVPDRGCDRELDPLELLHARQVRQREGGPIPGPAPQHGRLDRIFLIISSRALRCSRKSFSPFFVAE